jgi:ankyrin repeat protein
MSSVQQEQAGNNHSTADLLTEWFHYCANVESITEDGVRRQVDEFVQHGYQIEEDNDFLHALCLNEKVTEGMVRYLLDAFPGADKIIDDIGQTPLHCACHNEAIKEEVISCLIEHFPGAAAIADEKGRLPLHVAFEDNPNVTLSVVKILIMHSQKLLTI